MGDDFWQATAQMFGSLFEKPKMTEKLLMKPPFKYLFDIVMQTIKSTGFAGSLYTDEELGADFYDTKEKKIYFLRKIITLTSVMLKEEIDCKPNKVVAGIEPEKTNAFLQAMYRAAVSGEDSEPYIKKVLAKFAREDQAGGAEEEKQEEPKKAPKEEPKPKREEPKQEKPKAREEPKQEKPAEKPKQREEPKQEKPREQEKPQRPERPSSALKKPPQERSNVQVVEDKKKEGVSGIIRDDAGKKEDDDAFIETGAGSKGKVDLSHVDAAKHGKLVKDALSSVNDVPEAKGEEAPQGGSKIKMGKIGSRAKKETGGTVERQAAGTTATAGGEREGEGVSGAGSSANEVDSVQKLIQALTQNINPLRKSIDFINDDIESMNKEMEFWRNQYLGSKAKYQLELSSTEEQLQPLQNKLAELEEQIKDRKFKIQAVKSSTLQNEHKIQKLLYSVVSSK